MKNLLKIIVILVFLVGCKNQTKNGTKQPKSNFNLKQNYAEFQTRLNENDTLIIYANVGVCTSQLFEKITIIKKGKNLKIIPEFKEGNINNSEYDLQNSILLSENDTLWKFGEFLKRNISRRIRKNEMSNPRLRLKYKTQKIDLYTNGLSDANIFLTDYSETMRKINIDIIKYVTRNIDTVEWNKLKQLNEKQIKETELEIN
ncbi:MAG: hypothetical protein L3J23_08120 [Flavobacteriaceae bacterium]|nr:hypothetical protein [Flavobacteriaceae bacterium]